MCIHHYGTEPDILERIFRESQCLFLIPFCYIKKNSIGVGYNEAEYNVNLESMKFANNHLHVQMLPSYTRYSLLRDISM